MNKLLISVFILVGQTIFYSCHIPHDREIICEANFKKAKDLAYKNPTDSSALDSAINIVNRSMQCDCIKAAVVELKIVLLITLGNYDEGAKFIDSLQSSDFIFPYKKTLNHDNFIALNYASKGDTVSRDRIYSKMANELENYIKASSLKSKEFKEAFTELNALQIKFMDTVALHRELDSFKLKYPNEERFLDFFKH
jgi:hypothetical protein